MKKLIISLVLLFTCWGHVKAQYEGISFDSISFGEALIKAKEERKLVFIDCYTKTCGPCKYMAKFIFPQKPCGDYFNPRYVCIMKDMEEGDGKDIANKYDVKMYPTYLILSPDGAMQARFDGGAVKDASLFVQKIKDVLTIAEYDTIFQAGCRNDSFLLKYFSLLKEYDGTRLNAALGQALPPMGVDKLCSSPYWELIKENLNGTDSPLFQYLFNERSAFAKKVGKDTFYSILLSAYDHEFRLLVMMDLDWEKRIINLQSLEQEGCQGAKALRYRIIIHQIIAAKQKENVNRIREILINLPVQIPDEPDQVLIMKELHGLPRLLTEEQKKEFHQIISNRLKSFGTDNARSLSSILSQLEL